MKQRRKQSCSLLVLAVFLLSLLPLGVAQGNAGSSVSSEASLNSGGVESQEDTGSIGNTGNAGNIGTVQADEGEGDEEAGGIIEVELTTQAPGRRAAISNKLRVSAKSVDECIKVLKEKHPDVSGVRIRAACNNAFRLRVMRTHPELVRVLPQVKRFALAKPDVVNAFVEKLPPQKVELLKDLDRARLKKCLENTEECKEKIRKWVRKKVKIKDLIRKRIIAKNKILEANNAFLRAKNKYLEAKNLQLRARNEFLNLKAQLAECRASSEDCSDLEAQVLEKAKEDLIGIADRLIHHLEKIRSRIESAENIDEDEAEEAISNIDALIAELEDAKTAVEAVTNKDELQEAASTIRGVWREIEYKAFRYAERVIWGKVRGIFTRSELLEKKLERVVERLENKGVDTTEVQDLLDEFSTYIDEAREKVKQADEKFREAKDLRSQGDIEGAKEALEDAKSLTREAHQALKDAHRVLMELVHKINQSGESFDPDEINEDEEVEVVEEESEETQEEAGEETEEGTEEETQEICEDLCGDGTCQEVVCMGAGCPCAETPDTCPQDCQATIEGE